MFYGLGPLCSEALRKVVSDQVRDRDDDVG